MLDAASKSCKRLPYGCFLSKMFKHFKIKMQKGELRGKGNIYDLGTFSWMQFIKIGNA